MTDAPLARFMDLLAGLAAPNVLEVGTCRRHGVPTHHRDWLPPGASHVRMDIEDGEDVDFVGDVEGTGFSDRIFDAAIACSVLEHVRHPWLAAWELGRIVRPGGLLYLQTHQTFPYHPDPEDYWRFTTAALEVLFAGWAEVDAGYVFPCSIVPPSEIDVWNPDAPAWLNVSMVAVR